MSFKIFKKNENELGSGPVIVLFVFRCWCLKCYHKEYCGNEDFAKRRSRYSKSGFAV